MNDTLKFILLLAAVFTVARIVGPALTGTEEVRRSAAVTAPAISPSGELIARHKREVAEAIAAVRAAGDDNHMIAGILDLHYKATLRMQAEVEYGGLLSIGEQAALLNRLKTFNLPYEYELQEARSRRSLTDKDRARVGYAALLASQ